MELNDDDFIVEIPKGNDIRQFTDDGNDLLFCLDIIDTYFIVVPEDDREITHFRMDPGNFVSLQIKPELVEEFSLLCIYLATNYPIIYRNLQIREYNKGTYAVNLGVDERLHMKPPHERLKNHRKNKLNNYSLRIDPRSGAKSYFLGNPIIHNRQNTQANVQKLDHTLKPPLSRNNQPNIPDLKKLVLTPNLIKKLQEVRNIYNTQNIQNTNINISNNSGTINILQGGIVINVNMNYSCNLSYNTDKDIDFLSSVDKLIFEKSLDDTINNINILRKIVNYDMLKKLYMVLYQIGELKVTIDFFNKFKCSYFDPVKGTSDVIELSKYLNISHGKFRIKHLLSIEDSLIESNHDDATDGTTLNEDIRSIIPYNFENIEFDNATKVKVLNELLYKYSNICTKGVAGGHYSLKKLCQKILPDDVDIFQKIIGIYNTQNGFTKNMRLFLCECMNDNNILYEVKKKSDGKPITGTDKEPIIFKKEIQI